MGEALKLLVCGTALAVALGSLFGWGRLALRIAHRAPLGAAATVMIGLAALVFVGGVVNLAHIAYGITLDVLVVAGLALAVYPRPASGAWRLDKGALVSAGALALIILAIVGFIASVQLSPTAFNSHDDFEKYFAHPVRMLQTGALLGSPMSSLGLAVLGGMDFLHGLVLNHFPITALNGVDDVFGLLMCLALTASLGKLQLRNLPAAAGSVLLVFAINPQYVNVSALYLSSALVIVLLELFAAGDEDPAAMPSAMLAGMASAALVALKGSNALFPFLLACTHLLARLAGGARVRALLGWCVAGGVYLALFLSPWLLLHAPQLLGTQATPAFTFETAAIVAQTPLELFSTARLYWGSSFAHYEALAAALLLPPVALGYRAWKRKDGSRGQALSTAASSVAVLTCCAAIVGSGPRIFGWEENLRQAIPFLIGAVPALLVSACARLTRGEAGSAHRLAAALVAVEVALVALFAGGVGERVAQARLCGNLLAFTEVACSREYIAYSQEVLDGSTAARVARAQARVPEGEGLLVWISTPFLLDFRRNEIFDAEPDGLTNPWARMPPARFMMMQYGGFAVRPRKENYAKIRSPNAGYRRQGGATLGFLRQTDDWARQSKPLYNDGQIFVGRVEAVVGSR